MLTSTYQMDDNEFNISWYEDKLQDYTYTTIQKYITEMLL